MMREIKFRGKRLDNGEWVYGDLYRIMGFGTGPHWLIGTPDTEDYKDPEVDPATVGQYTGLKDMNGVEIYEGDVVNFHIFTQEFGAYMGVCEGEKSWKCSIEIETAFGIFLRSMENGVESAYASEFWGEHEESYEVTGNIHDRTQ